MIDAVLYAGLLATGVLYLRGVARLPHAVLPAGRRAAFVAGLLVISLATTGPVDAAADQRFAAHMAQHMVLMLVAAPLLAIGGPGLPLLLALPVGWRRRIAAWRGTATGRRVRTAVLAPAAGWLAHTVALWGWHLPVAFDAALRHPVVHGLEHASFVAAAVLFWSALVSPWRRRIAGPLGVLYAFATAMPAAALGAVLTLAATPLYPAQTGLGASALHDQQLAGVIMWLPADVVYFAVIVVLGLLWLRRLDREAPRTAYLPDSTPPDLPLPRPREVAR